MWNNRFSHSRRFAALSGALVVVGLLAGCASGAAKSTTGTPAATAPTATTGGGITVQLPTPAPTSTPALNCTAGSGKTAGAFVNVNTGNSASGTYAIDPASGATVWKCPLSSSSAPLYANGLVFMSGENSGEMLALHAKDGSLVWTAQVGQYSAAFIGLDNGLVFAVADGSPQGDIVTALDAATGTQKWSYTLPGSATNTFYLEPETPAVFANGVAYVTLTDHNATPVHDTLVALRESDGTVLWSTALAGVMSSPFNALQLAPVVSNGMVFLEANDASKGTTPLAKATSVEAINAATGAVAWSYDGGTRGAVQQTGLAAPASGIVLAALTTSQGDTGLIVGLNAASGAVAWQASLPVIPNQATTPVIVGNIAIIDTFGEVDALNVTTGAKIWNQQGGFASQPIAVGTTVYLQGQGDGQNGAIVALNAATGAQLWSASLPAQSYQCNLASGGGVLYCVDPTNGIFGINEQTGKVLWTFPFQVTTGIAVVP